MSGIEVAGILLGVLPLLISALEHYRETAEVLEDWWKFKRRYQKCKRDLEYLQLGFSANLEELLLPLICDDDQVIDLMSDPGGPAWHDPELEERLHERLSTAYDLYINSIGDIKEVMEKLTREIGLEKIALEIHRGETSTEASVLASAKSVYMQFTQRAKFALGQSNREKLLEEFTKYNDRLRDLLRTSDQLEKIKTTRKAKDKSITKLTSVIWKRAATLYQLLYNAWGCSCQASHRANLRLQDRRTEDSLSSFDITFLYSALSDALEKPWNRRNTSIVVVENPSKSNKLVHTTSSTLSTLSTLSPISTNGSMAATPPKSSFFSKMKTKKATFANESVVCFSSVTTLVSTEKSLPATLDTQGEDIQETEEDLHKEIDRLCYTLQGANEAEKSTCCGVLKDGDQHYQIFPNASKAQTSGADTFSLKDLLEQTVDVKLTRRQRYGLASALASSEVQLHSTPWLAENWDKAHILFFKSDLISKTASLDQPRLSTDFSLPGNKDMMPQDTSRDLKALGILLLELCFGCTLEKNEIRQKYPVVPGPHNMYLDIAAAHELCEHVVEEAGPEYAAAVEWCLKKTQSGTATDAEWRTELYENVVKPLQQCHGHLTG